MDRKEPETRGERRPCICLNCHTRIPYLSWITCLERNCPECGAVMVREGSPYHLYALEQGVAFDGRSRVPTRRPGKEPRENRTPAAQHQGA